MISWTYCHLTMNVLLTKFQVKTMGENKISFILSGTDASIANTLRKAMISEVGRSMIFCQDSATFDWC